MGTWRIALIGAVVILTGDLAGAGNEVRIEPLDGTHSLGVPSTGKEHPLAWQPVDPNDAGRPPAGTPFSSPLPPSQLTPAPVLPFNPNRLLTPGPSIPPTLSHPSDPPHAGTRIQRAPFPGGGRAGR